VTLSVDSLLYSEVPNLHVSPAHGIEITLASFSAAR
jgi:hypothetical protein